MIFVKTEARTEAPRAALSPQPSGLCTEPQPCAGAVVSGAPPTEIGPIGFSGRAILLRATLDSRARARPFGMEEVISDVIAFCNESTFTISVES